VGPDVKVLLCCWYPLGLTVQPDPYVVGPKLEPPPPTFREPLLLMPPVICVPPPNITLLSEQLLSFAKTASQPVPGVEQEVVAVCFATALALTVALVTPNTPPKELGRFWVTATLISFEMPL
jgi:hypothetical protein